MVVMTSRVIVMSGANKKILGARAINQSEKENQQAYSSIIVRNDRLRESSDSDSDGWAEKKKHYVTREDGLQKRRTRPASAASPVPPCLPPHVIARRNERERNRVRQVNDSFTVLRNHIPSYLLDASEVAEGCKGARKKLSKVETLRLAVHYIQKLERLLDIQTDACHSDDERMQLFESESQMSSQKTDSEMDSDIMDLSSDPRRGSSLSEDSRDVKLEDDLVCEDDTLEKIKAEEDFEGESHGGSTSVPYPSFELPSISSFPSGLTLHYSDMYSQ